MVPTVLITLSVKTQQFFDKVFSYRIEDESLRQWLDSKLYKYIQRQHQNR